MRAWIWSVTLFAIGVAAFEIAQLSGWQSPVPDIAVSATLAGGLIIVFAGIFLSMRAGERACVTLEQ
jgi:hypothetical protein